MNDTITNEYRIHGAQMPLPPSYKRMVDRLYREPSTHYQKSLRAYMFLTWTIDQLKGLRYKHSEIL